MRERLTQLISLVGFLTLWYAVAEQTGTHIIPGPGQVVEPLTRILESGQFLGPLVGSLVRVALGFALGFTIGVLYGIAAGRSPQFSFTASALFNVFLFAPTLVVIFLGVVMMGPTDLTAILITAFIIFPGIGVAMRSVVRALDNEILQMADSYKVNLADRIRGIYVPYLIPPMLSAGRTGFSHAWKIVLLTEVFGLSGGLGFEIRQSYFIYNLPLLIAWLTLFIFVLLVLEQAIRSGERLIVRWQ